MSRVRFGDYVRETALRQRRVSFNDLVAQTPEQAARVHVHTTEAAALLKPHLTPRFKEQARAVVPLALYLVLFQLLLLRPQVARSWAATGGLLAVIVGLLLFMEGLKLGLMPLGETIGNPLPKRSPLPVVLIVCFLLGIGVTLAEPAGLRPFAGRGSQRRKLSTRPEDASVSRPESRSRRRRRAASTSMRPAQR
jgi:hypothetical protein